MSLPNSVKDREYQKFQDSPEGAAVRIISGAGVDVNPLAQYVEAAYTNENKTVTYRYYESASKATLYNTITTTFSVPQDTTFISAAWE